MIIYEDVDSGVRIDKGGGEGAAHARERKPETSLARVQMQL